jgi:glucose-1-phosphate adenylyltransferase
MLLHNTLTILLAGGRGARLEPLTADRAKPAVPFGGKYRVVDFTLSNCLHSGLRRILVLTQYKSHSLHKHLRDGWSIFNAECGDFITVVPPQMRTGPSWYSGTADALYQNLFLLDRSLADKVLILAADHIYRMDYAALVKAHEEADADLTVACMRVPLAEAGAFGVMAINEDKRIVEFNEKPADPKPMPGEPDVALASMGIYVFAVDRLREALEEDHKRGDSSHDFGKDVIPRLIGTHKVYAYRFGGSRGRVTQDRYWRDVGTLDAYYDANMDLLKTEPPLDLYQRDWAIRTYQSQNPPARMVPGPNGQEGVLANAILCGGTVIYGAVVRHSILSSRVHVHADAVIEDSLLFDSVTVGAGARLRRCIVDKGVHIPPGETVGIDAAKDAARFAISANGVIVVPKAYRFG